MATNNGTSTASGVVFSSLSHAGKTQTVALFPGLSIDELTSLLRTIFGISSQQNIVGINAERGLVIPLSLVCRTPTVIPNSVCKLLVSPLASRDGTVVDNQDNVEKLAAETPEKMTDADSTEFVMQEILKFIDSLYRQKFLDSIQRRALADLLLENSTLLFAAYSVAVSANDSEYLAEICKDLAISMATEQGKLACEAQDEVLQVCDQLYLNEKITENQLLYLRHLVLIREEPVAALYDDFQEHQSVPLLAKSLYELAFTHPYQNHSDAAKSEATKTAPTNEEEEDDDEDDVDDDEDLYEREKLAQKTQLQLKKRTSAGDEKSAAAKKETEQSSKESAIQGLTGALTLMIRTKFITEEEALVLYEMIRNQNEYVMAAYELYCYDNKLDELQDTLLRVAKLEIRKKIASSREMALNAAQKSMLYDENDEKEDDDEEDEDEGDDVDNNDEDEDDAKYSDDYDEEPIELESIRLESLLEALDVHNIWSKTVPDKFIQAVFVAAVRSQLSIAQARALCDLFHANYDLVHAAWEVYTVQKDKDDFIDSLARIVRDLDFDEDGVIPELKPSTAASAPSSEATKKNVATSTQAAAPTKTAAPAPSTAKPAAATAPAPSVPKANTAASTKKGESPSKESSGPSSQQEAQRNEIIDRKKEAIAAVAAAKKDLLKHSLDMMVKQNLTSAVSADRLIERYSQGDALVDAAIEAYAADRDVNEFLDTLHILANHSKEELEDMMRQSDADGDSQSNNSKPNSTTLSVPEAVLEQIVGIVEEMRKNDMISTVAEEILRGLIRKQDSRVISAFKVYVQVKDGADLIDSLLRIAAYEVAQRNIQSQQPKQGPSSASASAQEEEEEEEEEEEDDQEMQEGGDNSDSIGANADGTVLSAGDQKTVVQILLRANAVDEPQAAYLNELIDLGDVQVRKVFYEYEQDKNVYKLIAALKAYNKPAVSRDDNSESYEDDFEEDADEDDRAAVEDRFFSIIKAMSLSHLETAALRLAIARDDEEIRKVITQFKADRNEEVLKRQLRALAVKTINETIDDDDDDDEEEENGKATDADQDDEDDEEDEDDADDDAGYGNHESKGKFDFSYSQQRPASSPGNSAMNFQGYWGRSAASAFGPASTFRALDQKNGDDDDDDNDEDEDDDDEAEEDEEDADGNDDEQADDDDDDDDDELPTGRSTLTSQTARQHVFPILVAELVRENIIGKKEGSSIMDQFNSGNPVVSAALDVYDRNNNMAQLVDTLQQMVTTQA